MEEDLAGLGRPSWRRIFAATPNGPDWRGGLGGEKTLLPNPLRSKRTSKRIAGKLLGLWSGGRLTSECYITLPAFKETDEV